MQHDEKKIECIYNLAIENPEKNFWHELPRFEKIEIFGKNADFYLSLCLHELSPYHFFMKNKLLLRKQNKSAEFSIKHGLHFTDRL